MGHETELHRAVRATLIADTTVNASTGGRIVDVAPPELQTPCIELGGMIFAAGGTDNSDEIEATLNLGIYARGSDARTVIRRIAGEITNALHRKASALAMASWRALTCRYLDTTIFETEANPTAPEYKGVVRFTLLLERSATVTGS